MKYSIKAILFDCDGTIVDSEDAHYASWKYAFEKHGGLLSVEKYHTLIGKPIKTIASIMEKELGKASTDQIIQDKIDHFKKSNQEGIPAILPTLEFIYRLVKEKDRYGYKLAVASGAPKEDILAHLEHLQIVPLFDAIISGQDDLGEYHDPEGVNKPKPYVYLHTAKKLGVLPQECIVIEDSHSGVAAGVAAGCYTIAVPNRYSSYQDLSHAACKIESFANLSVEQFLSMARRGV